jgi:hypothetical protein
MLKSLPTPIHAPGLASLSFHRNAVFYLGFFPLVILLWLWADSVQSHTNWHHRLADGGTRGFIITNSKFIAERIIRQPDYNGVSASPLPFYGGIIRFGAPPCDSQGKPMPIFPPLDWHDEESTNRAPGFHVDTLVVPLWFVLACYLPAWAGLTCYHSFRKRRRHFAELPEGASKESC